MFIVVKWLRWSVPPFSALIWAHSPLGLKRMRGVGSTGTEDSRTTVFALSSLMVILNGLPTGSGPAAQPTASKAVNPMVQRGIQRRDAMACLPVLGNALLLRRSDMKGGR